MSPWPRAYPLAMDQHWHGVNSTMAVPCVHASSLSLLVRTVCLEVLRAQPEGGDAPSEAGRPATGRDSTKTSAGLQLRAIDGGRCSFVDAFFPAQGGIFSRFHRCRAFFFVWWHAARMHAPPVDATVCTRHLLTPMRLHTLAHTHTAAPAPSTTRRCGCLPSFSPRPSVPWRATSHQRERAYFTWPWKPTTQMSFCS